MLTLTESLNDQSLKPAVSLERDGGCLVIVIDNPPVNVCSLAVRQGLIAAFGILVKTDVLTRAVIIGAGKTFVSGSDIKEFGFPLLPPEMPQVLAAIVACPKPVIAAMHGAAMGGGFEIALACDGRIAAADLYIALPEVKLGIIPGAGGTQRVPRLTGLSFALEMITTGRRIPAREALKMGLVDRVTSSDLRSEAIRFAQSFPGKCDLALVSVPLEPLSLTEAAVSAALKKRKGRPFVAKAIEAVLWSATTPLDAGLLQERAAFQTLRVAGEADALRHLFFAEREAPRIADLAGIPAMPVTEVAVVGAGTMGVGIATTMLEAGYETLLVDKDSATLARAVLIISETQARALKAGRIDAATAKRRLALLTTTADIASVCAADLVIEAVYEDMGVKTAIMATLDQAMKPEAILATNTSYLDIDVLANATRRPAQVLGLHFFSPANIMRLLEIVRGKNTSVETLATGFAVGKKLGKVSILAGVCEGFIGNRIYNAYRNQCEFMLEDGALPHEIDAALEEFGFAMGPFRVSDLSGLDIAWATRKRQATLRDPRTRYVAILDKLCEKGRLGQKTQAGWYAYSDGNRRGEVDAKVSAIIVEYSASKGIARRAIAPDEIVARAIGAIVNEACLILSDGLAQRPSDIDLVMVNGYGFPDYLGGPLFWASRRGPASISAAIDRVQAATGFGFKRADLAMIFYSAK